MIQLSRRKVLAALGRSVFLQTAGARPKGYLVENTIHMFAEDQTRFPFHSSAPYKPPANSLDKYIAFVKEAKLDHTILVQPEPYQDDHRYIEYCFTREPSPGYFKATCLFDPIDPKTPARIDELVKRNPGRIVGMRIHEVHPRGTPFTTTGPIKDRDLNDPGMKRVFRKMQELGLIVQVQMIPCYASQLGELASGFSSVPVLIDHFGLMARGTPEEYTEVVKLAKLPQFYMKMSQLPPNAKPAVRRVYDAFGPDRLIWGAYGSNLDAFNKELAQIDDVFDFTPEAERIKSVAGMQ